MRSRWMQEEFLFSFAPSRFLGGNERVKKHDSPIFHTYPARHEKAKRRPFDSVALDPGLDLKPWGFAGSLTRVKGHNDGQQSEVTEG